MPGERRLVAGAPRRAFPASGGGVSSDLLVFTGQSALAANPAGSAPPGSAVPAGPAEIALPARPGSHGPVLHARPAVDFWEHVPGATALLVPVAAGLAILVGLVLGPTGRPAPVFRRQGGLSRALARRPTDA